MKIWVMACVLTLAFLVGGRALAKQEEGHLGGLGAGRLSVFVSIPPQAFVVERVGGPHVEVQVLVGAGRDPHTYEPTPKQVVDLSRCALYLTIGFPFEERIVEKIRGARPDLRLADMSAGIPRRSMTEEEMEAAHPSTALEAGEHECHGHHEHEHPSAEPGAGEHDDDSDPHVWLAPLNVKAMAANTAAAFKSLDPAHAADYDANLAALQKELDEMHQRIARLLEPCKGRAIYVYHPAFGYFADAYGLVQRAVEVGGKSPTPRQLTELIRQAKSDGVRIIFVQPQFDSRSAEAVAKAIGGAVVPMDDLSSDVLGNFRDMADKIEVALGPRTDEGGQPVPLITKDTKETK